MSDLHELYLVACPNQKVKAESLSKEKNHSLALTFAGASQQLNLSISDLRNSSKNAQQAQEYAKLAIQQYKARQTQVENIVDLETIRKQDEQDLKIIRINRFVEKTNSEPELSDTRKLYYNAAKAFLGDSK